MTTVVCPVTDALLKRIQLQHQEETAHHEAGHAVAAVILRKQFRYVTIGFAVLSDGRRTFGHMAWVPKGSFCPELDSEKRTRFICERSAIIHFAGPIAGARFLGRKRWGEGCTHDLDWAAKMINHISRTRNESRANRKRLREQAEMLVSDHSIAIQAVACELLAKRRLSYQEVRRIMRKGKETSYT
jgi:ATP-dependent Zn protease